MIYALLHITLLLPLGVFSLFAGYLLLLTVAAMKAAKSTRVSKNQTHRFLILIPAHNEERLLPSTLENLNSLEYPRQLFEIHVAADNCTDQTANATRQGGATAHERSDPTHRGKGFALEWLLKRLWEAKIPHDAIVILDADTIVSSNFLQVMDARLASGERAIQANYAVRDPGRSWPVSIRYIALAAIHYLRPLGRMVLGGSAGLKGNGMVFAADIMKDHQWSAHLTEDIEFHMQLILAGQRVTFAPDAVVEAEMPDTLQGSQTQNARWERGRVEMAQRYLPALWRAAWKALCSRDGARAYQMLDAIAEHLIPPFSIFSAAAVSLLFIAIILPGGDYSTLKWINMGLGASVLFAQMVYTFASLLLVRAPKKIYAALLYAPVFVFWKVWLFVKVLFKTDQQEWVRTARNEP